MKITNHSKSFFAAVLGLAASIFCSCSNIFNVPVKNYFKEYTETAAIDEFNINAVYTYNSNGIICLDSSDDAVIDFYLRNPQQYELGFEYSLTDDANGVSIIPTNFEQSEDLNSVKLSLSKDLLTTVDKGTKDLSGTITLIASAGRKVENYNFVIHANTVPPAVQGACYQLTAEQDGYYVVCFYLPDVNYAGAGVDFSRHSGDTRTIYFNNQKRYFNQNKIYKDAKRNEYGIWEFSNEDDMFKTSTEGDLYPVTGEDGFKFATDGAPNGYTAIYYYTGVKQTANTTTMDISVVDDEGLTSKVSISNKAEQLTAPYIADISTLATGIVVDEKTRLAEIKLCHDGKTTSGSSVTSVSIEYQVYDISSGETLVKSGTVAANSKISLKTGKYKITAKATKPYYIASEDYDSRVDGQAPYGILLKPADYFYVKNDGDDSNAGTYDKPFRTINKAIEEFRLGVSAGNYQSTDVCTIRLLSDLTPSDDDNFASQDPYLVILTDDSYVIEGYNGTKRTIDVQGTAETGNRGIFEIYRGANVTLKNLILTGGYTNHKASVIYQAGYSDIVLENVDITGNTNTNNNAVDVNSTLYFASGDVKYKSGKVYGNTTVTGPSAFYIKGTLELGSETGLVEIYDNTLTAATVFSACYVDTGTLKIKKAKIYNNKNKDGNQANVYIPTDKKITVTGNLTGCKIGVKTQASPSFGSPVVFTEGFGANNAAAAGTIFVSDNSSYGISLEGSGSAAEACVTLSGGAMSDVITSQSVTFACTQYQTVSGVSAIRFYPGTAKEINITPALKINDTEVAADSPYWSSFTWKTWLTNEDETITGSIKTGSGKTIEALIPAAAIYEENYTLNVKATINGVSYDGEWLCKAVKDISYMDSAPTSAGTYYIDSVEGLKKLKTWINAGSGSNSGIVYELTKDIDVNSDFGIGDIGTRTNPFKGKFDGKGHKITNVYIYNATASDSSGFFAYTNNAEIKNLTITGRVTGSSLYKGGIVGMATATKIIDCVNEAKVSNTVQGGYSAGIVGICKTGAGTEINGCINTGEISAVLYSAGIITFSENGISVRNCMNKGEISVTGSGGGYAGGIAAKEIVNVINCCNYGSVKRSNINSFLGGIKGNSSSSYELTNCVSYASIGYNEGTKNVGIICGTTSIKDDSKLYYGAPIDAYVSDPLGQASGTGAINQNATFKFTNNGASSSTNDSVTVGNYTGTDVVELLNAWIEAQTNPSLYKRWKYDAMGYPVFED